MEENKIREQLLDHQKIVQAIPAPRNFTLMVLGQVVSIMGSVLLRFALSLFVLDQTGRADIFATLLAVSSIPLVLGPFGGAIADRFNRRNLMVIYDFTSSGITITLFFLLWRGNNSILLIGLIMVLLSFISAMYNPTVSASIPLLVAEQKIEKANGIVSAVQALGSVLAPVLGSLLYGYLPIDRLILISGVAFFLSAVMELFIHIPFEKGAMNGKLTKVIMNDLKEGFIYVRKEPFIYKSVLLAAALNMLVTPILIVAVPAILRLVMHSSELMYGLGNGLIGLAMVFGALTIGFFTKKLRFANAYLWLLGLSALVLPIIVAVLPIVLSLGNSWSFLILMSGAIPISMLVSILSIFLISKVQRKTPNEQLGKVMAIIMAAAQCSLPLGQLLYGKLLDTFETQLYLPLFFVTGILVFVSLGVKKGFKNIVED
ncbi:MFS transporter [Candidatus Enterococcus ferrettii]|uniref:Major facilitator superfamily (MFS) profile domain-containing protein n=1 Tax=Candidatus Enterococcus ferrettii TaxID=2815324 RepID=A0ABV0EQD0_9ENTE|nr:MFS transporter [Enterococcus sp. 665A]MBO1339306.1 MFS transporter [Enterococcus sp. 665A]